MSRNGEGRWQLRRYGTRAAATLFTLLVYFTARPANAQAASAPPSNERVTLRRPWVLLDPYTARHTGQFALGWLSFRSEREQDSKIGYSLAVGEGVTTQRGAFVAGGRWEHELHLVPSETIGLSISRYQWEAGPRLGPIEPMARVGFTLAGVDLSRDSFSFGMFSPRAAISVFVHFQAVRVGVSAFTEYWWRWIGDESAFVRGMTLELQPRLEPLRKKNPHQRTRSSP